MKLSQLLKNITPIGLNQDCLVEGLSYDSREVKKDYLFVAVKGLSFDGHDFLNQVIANGACAALVEKLDPNAKIAQIKVQNSRQALALASSNFYAKPTEDLFLVGITGTNGKTTTTFMLESIFQAAGQQTGLVGTVSYRIGKKSFPVSHTTPESLQLQGFFRQMVDSGVNTALVEVSSHSAQLHRIDGCNFDQVIFTNLTQDHLDFHHDFENYFNAKKRLFEINSSALHIINFDDEFGKQLIGFNRQGDLITFGFEHGADFRASEIKVDTQSSSFNVNYEGHVFRFEVMIGGSFNIYNALVAIVSATKAGISAEVIQQGFYNLPTVPGRFEAVPLPAPFKVIVDYAHTPDGLENLLISAREVTKGRLITVFGCGGERDKGKRPQMGRIAYDLSDLAVVTSDNPRSEDPQDIVEAVTCGNNAFLTEADREKAIFKALNLAEENDTIVIAGKGHESTQEINGQHLPFNDKEVVLRLWELQEAKSNA